MKLYLLLIVLLLSPSLVLGDAPATQPFRGDRQDFVVRAIAPALPALKYELTIDPVDRQPGDAAGLYLQAMLLMPADSDKIVEKEGDLRDAGKSLADDPIVTDLMKRSAHVFELVRLASRREQCDWNVPFRQLGIATMLPQMNPVRAMANLLMLRFYQQIDADDLDSAFETIREEYALARHIAKGSALIGSLVSAGIASVASHMVEVVSARADAPNLYWPLASMPGSIVTFREALEEEGPSVIGTVPVLAKGRNGGITAEDWPAYLKQLADFSNAWRPATAPADQEPAPANMWGEILPHARSFYSTTRHISADQAAQVDSRLVLATYFIEQYQIVADEETRLTCLPLWDAVEQSRKIPARLKALGIEDSNPGAIMAPAWARLPTVFGRMERTVAALMAVHALRAYAADHAGQLPAKLEDVTETPIPVNPMTGKMFSYRLDGNTATISDETSLGTTGRTFPLVYTVRIR